jgi:hypothetical protein
MSEEWFVATIQTEKNALIIRALAILPEHYVKSKNPKLVVIKWVYDGESTPDPKTMELILKFEDAIFDSIENDKWAIEAASLTGNGTKEWRLYCDDLSNFMAGFNSALIEHSPYPIDLQTFEDPEWIGLNELQPNSA